MKKSYILDIANTNDAASNYIDRGWHPVPIPKGEKGPSIAGWQEGRYKPNNFSPTQNLGIILDLSGLSEADFDCEEAAYAGRNFLPQSLDSGRGGKLRKRFFRCALDKEYRDLGTFTDGKWKPGDKILEVRHKGKQAMVAPSTHPSGERVEWLNDLEPTQIDPEDLREQCDKVATVALIARHLPEGGRHELALAYAGFLLRKGLSEDDVLKVLTAAWEYVGAPKQAFRDLEATVSDTAEKLANDEPATGGNTLTQLIPGMIDALCDVWGWEKALTPEEKEEQERQERKRKAEEAWPVAEEIAKDLDILSRYYETMKADGLVGEETNAKLLALIAATRHISKPMSVMVDGPSSGGKSELIKRITKLLPPHFIRELQSMSERALAYVGDMRNQILVVYELGGLGNEGKESLEMMKQLLTEGCIKRQIAESTPQGVRGRLIEVEGPTGLWTTTTKVVTDHELNNRLFKITVDDSQDQTRGIIRNIFVEDRASVDYEPFRAHHVWLEGQDNRVTLPFGKALGETLVDSAVRMRRDAARVRDLICAHAVLHQVTRERDPEGRITATLDDYEAVRSLIDNIIGVAAEKSVSPTIRETVNLAQELIEKEEPVTRISLGKKLGIDKTTAGRRLGAAKSGGYLRHNEDAEGSQKEYVIGDPLPDKKLALPTKEALAEIGEGCRGALDSGREGQGQNHDENCSDAACTVDAPVHAPPDDSRPLEEPQPLTYQGFSSEDSTETAEPPLSEIPCTPCTPHGEECPNTEECMHPCARSALSPEHEKAWEQIVVLWEHEKATQHIVYMNDSHETDPYTWAARLETRYGLKLDISAVRRAMFAADIYPDEEFEDECEACGTELVWGVCPVCDDDEKELEDMDMEELLERAREHDAEAVREMEMRDGVEEETYA